MEKKSKEKSKKESVEMSEEKNRVEDKINGSEKFDNENMEDEKMDE